LGKFLDKVSIKPHVDASGDLSLSVKSIVGTVSNPTTGITLAPVKKIRNSSKFTPAVEGLPVNRLICENHSYIA